jgi:hypothetical protein
MLAVTLTDLPGLSRLGGTITSIPIQKVNGIQQRLFHTDHQQAVLLADLTWAAKLPR